jgi:hypothetical protein
MIGLPGTEMGHCVAQCKHKECASARMISSSVCTRCGEAIGYLRPFEFVDPSWYRHIDFEKPEIVWKATPKLPKRGT